MNSELEVSRYLRQRGVSDLASAGVLTLGVVVLVGWWLDTEVLKRVASGYVTMNPLTAVCFVASAVALWLSDGSPSARAWSSAIAWVVLVVVTWQFIADLSDAPIQPDEFIFSERINLSVPISRMAPSTAVGLFLAMVSLLLLLSGAKERRNAGQYFAMALGSVALFSAIAYTYGAGKHIILRPFNLMALHTSWGLFILAVGLLFKDTRSGLMSFIVSKGLAGQLLRWMIPAVVIVPTILGWLIIRAEQAGFFGTSLSVTMLASFSMILLFMMTIATARMILRADGERQRRLKAVRASQQRLSGILAIAADAIISIDSRQRITLFNAWAEQLFGYEHGEVLGQKLEILIPERLRAAHSSFVEDFGKGRVAARRMGDGRQILARRKDGSTFPAEASISRLTIEGETIFTVVLRDMTEQLRNDEILIRAKNDAEAAARSQSEFLANMSHEIRTPLNSIAGFTQLMLGNDALQGELRAQTTKIKNSATALTAVVNDILDYSKLEEGMLTLSMSAISPAQLVRSCASIVGPTASARGLEIHLEIAPSVEGRFYVCDAHRMQQILLNLMSNAVKFTETGSVTVRVAEVDGDDDSALVRFEVVDTGIGIAPSNLARLFRRFSQVDGSVSRTYGGTGLGLAICKRIVTLLGGEIGVETEPGKGSTFWFRLPMERTQALAQAGDELGLRPEKSEERSILLVEDIELNREIAVAMLEKAGHTVDVACDGSQAVSKVADRRYDLILMDIQMPTMDGITATKKIRSLDGANSAVPIIAMTANVLPDEVERFRAAGMNGHISKPIEADQLIAQVDRWTASATEAA